MEDELGFARASEDFVEILRVILRVFSSNELSHEVGRVLGFGSQSSDCWIVNRTAREHAEDSSDSVLEALREVMPRITLRNQPLDMPSSRQRFLGLLASDLAIAL